MKPTPQQTQGIIRHTLTFLGGILVTKGYLDEETVTQTSGLISSLIGIIWSIWSKK